MLIRKHAFENQDLLAVRMIMDRECRTGVVTNDIRTQPSISTPSSGASASWKGLPAVASPDFYLRKEAFGKIEEMIHRGHDAIH